MGNIQFALILILGLAGLIVGGSFSWFFAVLTGFSFQTLVCVVMTLISAALLLITIRLNGS